MSRDAGAGKLLADAAERAGDHRGGAAQRRGGTWMTPGPAAMAPVVALARQGLGGSLETFDLHGKVPAGAPSEENPHEPGEWAVLAEGEGDHRSLAVWLHDVTACGDNS